MESSWTRGLLVESSWRSERRGPTRGLVDQKSLVDSSWTPRGLLVDSLVDPRGLVDSWTRGLSWSPRELSPRGLVE